MVEEIEEGSSAQDLAQHSREPMKVARFRGVFAELRREREEAARQAGVAEVASGVLHNVANVLNSVNVSATLIADQLRDSQLDNLSKLAAMLREHSGRLSEFVASDPRGREIPGYLDVVVGHLRRQQESLLNEVAGLCRSVEHIKEIVAMQQSYSRVAGTREILSMPDLIEDALRMNEAAFERHGVRVTRDYAADTPSVLVDRHRVLQILINLFRNAKHALDERGHDDKEMCVRLRVADGGRVEVSVSDNGVGISPEQMGRMFEHGFTTRRDGHGYGLNAGRRAAVEMGGALTCASGGRNRGATFVLSLPAGSRADASV